MNQFTKNSLLWLLIAFAILIIFNLMGKSTDNEHSMPYSEFISKVDAGNVANVSIVEKTVTGTTTTGQKFSTYTPEDPGLVAQLLNHDVSITAKPPKEPPFYMTLLVSWFPMLLLIGVWIFFMRQMNGGVGGKGGAMSFGRSRAKLLNQEQGRVTFSDVAGVDEAKDELVEVVEFLSNPKKFTRLGGRIPKGVLLVGPPGTGKTLLARAVAGEAGVPFFSISGSDFVEMFVGVGASRVRDLFVQGKKNAPCLIFIDEIDAVGRQRGVGIGGGHDEREQTLNQLLVEMDGFESNEGVILIAATNRPDVLDSALLRPGRFDRQVIVPTPDLKGRQHIINVHAKKTPLAEDVKTEVLAKGTPGFSGADLENLVNEAALQAAKKGKDELNMSDFEYAKDKILMGRERRSLILSDEEKRITAYHEAGHALIAKLLPKADPVHKVSIIPRGRALGVTMQLPEEDRHGYSRGFLEGNITVLLAGRVAEELIMDDITTGAGNDIERASKLAKKMVCEWGMSDTIGPLAIGDNANEGYLGRDMGAKAMSEETAKKVDEEIKRIINTAHEQCHTLIKENLEHLHSIANALLERETISGEDIDKLMKGEELPPYDLNEPDNKNSVDPIQEEKERREAEEGVNLKKDEDGFSFDSEENAKKENSDDKDNSSSDSENKNDRNDN